MISPEGYFEEYLKGKTIEQMMTAIRGLKQEMGRLKNVMESPSYGQELTVSPSEDTRIQCTREYLKRARLAYFQAGGTYSLSKSEEKTADFDSNIDAISKIAFSIGGFFGGCHSYVVELSDGLKAYSTLWEDKESMVLFNDDSDEPFTKETFLAALADLHIGEWRRNYSTKRFGYEVCDGTQWELEFECLNGHKPVRFDGDNSYPYNFDKFKMLFGIYNAEEEEDE